MGGEIKTNVSDDFKSLEIEMELRQQGKATDAPVRTTHTDAAQVLIRCRRALVATSRLCPKGRR